MFWKICLWVWGCSGVIALFFTIIVTRLAARQWQNEWKAKGMVYKGEKMGSAMTIITYIKIFAFALCPILNTLLALAYLFMGDRILEEVKTNIMKDVSYSDT